VEPSARATLRIVLIVVLSAFALYMVACAAGPVNVLERRMRRGLAIALVYRSSSWCR
jgi:hypothetical protein